MQVRKSDGSVTADVFKACDRRREVPFGNVSARVAIYIRFAAFGMSMCIFCSVPEEALAIPVSSAICASDRVVERRACAGLLRGS